MARLFVRFVPVVAVMLIACACGDDDTPTSPTNPTTVTDTFSGTINRNGAITHPFSTLSGGTVSATLVTVAPDNTTVIGLSLGTWNGAVCQYILANDKAVQGVTVTGTASALGSFCVRVYDVGSITQPTSYEVQVIHP